MELDNHILAVVEPAILPTEIKMEALGEEGGGDKQTKEIGGYEPFVLCNGVQIKYEKMDSFTMDLSGVMPRCTVDFTDGAFGVDSFPRDGDFFTVLINSKHQETFKSVHMDFDIIEVSTDAQGGVIIQGICKIPKMYKEDCQVLDPETSIKQLELIVRELEIGLATNVDATDDKQSRIQAYETYSDFIGSIVEDSYISDDAFVKYHFDQYYYLNYVDINKIFNSKNPKLDEVTKALTAFSESQGANRKDEDSTDSDNVEVPLLLTNHLELKGLNCHIEQYDLINNSAKISLSNGQSRTVQMYDNNSDKGERFQEFTVEPLATEELSELDEPLKGNKKDERYKDQVKFKYMGRQNAGEDGLGNTHSNAIYTKLHRQQNQMEIEKMKLQVSLSGFNSAIYKFCKIPVLMYHYDGVNIEAEQLADTFREEAGLKERPFGAAKPELGPDDKVTQMMDKFLSGFYIVENINYSFDKDAGITTDVTLIRREWPSRSRNLS